MSGNRSWMESTLKGDIARVLFEQILQKSGNKIQRTGWETIFPFLAQSWEYERDTIPGIRILRNMPDFIVVDKANQPSFVEIKYRKKGEHRDTRNDFKTAIELWHAHLVLVTKVSKPYFRIATPPYPEHTRGNLVWSPLFDVPYWNIEEREYQWAEELVEKYYPAD